MTRLDEPTLRPRANVLLTELGDGTGALLDLDTKFYFTLNHTGVAIWKSLSGEGGAQGGGEWAALTAMLCRRFAVAPEQAASDLEAFVVALNEAGLIELDRSEGPGGDAG